MHLGPQAQSHEAAAPWAAKQACSSALAGQTGLLTQGPIMSVSRTSKLLNYINYRAPALITHAASLAVLHLTQPH